MTVMIPKAMRARIDASEESWRSGAIGEVVYIGHRTIVLRVTGALAPVTTPGAGVMPNGVELCERSDFDSMRGMLHPGDAVDLAEWRRRSPLDATAVDLTIAHGPVSPLAVARLQSAVAAAPVPAGMAGRMAAALRASAPLLASAVADDADTELLLASLIGAGPGTTPTGDDIVLGFLAALRASGDADRALALGRSIHPLLSRTTETARYFLRHAMQGRFAEHVHDAVTSVRSPERVDAVVADAAHWGATSGTDLLAGLTAGASVALTTRRAAA